MEQITLASVRDTPLSVDEVLAAVQDPRAGGTAVFIGTVRDHDHGRDVARLGYSAHPTVEAMLRTVMEKVLADTAVPGRPVVRLAAVHRVGDLEIGDLAVVVAASAAHREEAFAACRRLIDDLKAQVPIWKHQAFTDGDQEWVGTP
ncbi:molybdenum cofactor biosynthesis protein MoaE [Nocardiopsis changdeensis]|uniref:Molybdenum cofactor biosynthesis protein MoaE n=1 Tax=Nocardiopsis changdeensis TaxID=2831969 RepID=A0ABX8BR90_9ACTN|nr:MULTISPECIES: molybdenum cofactor biosynthesis protein MoaE [Nocardiopsis]QUX23789.1 molybdenum cofactor biosynthesis protein MoaE [Nocardiopsis changdeensis]QYX39734.1 molybdenum cofactor biosynthesis protein MoaE [Nocardiopsis sp. MT53]